MPAREVLEVFRLLYGVALAGIVLARLASDYRFVRAHSSSPSLPRLLGLVSLPRLPAGVFLPNGLLLAALLAAGGAGVVPPACLALAGGCALLHFAQTAGRAEVHRKANTVPVILGLLYCGSQPGAGAWDPAWLALLTIKLLIVQVYFSAAIAKLAGAGWSWTDGQTLRRWLAYYHLRDENPFALRLAASGRVCRALALLVLLFELTFWLVIPFPVLAGLYLPAAIMFHVATAVLMRIHYWLYLGPAYLVFVAPWLIPAS